MRATTGKSELRAMVKRLHQDTVRQGKYLVARRILRLLFDGSITCGVGNVDWEVTKLLNKADVRSSICSSGRYQEFYLRRQ